MNQNKINTAIVFGLFFFVAGLHYKEFLTMLAGAAILTLIFE